MRNKNKAELFQKILEDNVFSYYKNQYPPPKKWKICRRSYSATKIKIPNPIIKLKSSEKNFAETSQIPLQNKTSPIPVSNKRRVRLVKTLLFNSVPRLFYFKNATAFTMSLLLIIPMRLPCLDKTPAPLMFLSKSNFPVFARSSS